MDVPALPGVVETQSRGPLIAFALDLPMLAIGPCGAISRTRRMTFLGGLAILFIVVMPGFYEHAIQRFSEIDKETTTEEGRTRQTVWIYAGQMIAEHPIAGIGFGEKQFVKEMEALGFSDRYNTESLDNPHNSYLQMAVYGGIPLLATFLVANLILLWTAGVASWRNDGSSTTASLFGLAVGILGFLAAIYPDMHMFTQDVGPVYWTFFGLLLSLTTQVALPVPVTPALRPDMGRPTPRRLPTVDDVPLPVVLPLGFRTVKRAGDPFPGRGAPTVIGRRADNRRQR
jgi:O-antigen ligase